MDKQAVRAQLAEKLQRAQMQYATLGCAIEQTKGAIGILDVQIAEEAAAEQPPAAPAESTPPPPPPQEESA